MSTRLFQTRSSEQTQALGRELGRLVAVGDLLLLYGMLGSGKTTLTQGLAWGAGVDGYAHSPTFVLVNQYEGRIPVYHADLYRVEGGSLEAHDLGFEEMLDEGVCVVEWPENAPLVFQESHLSITISFGDDPDDRAIKVQAHGERYHRLMEDLWKAVVK